MNKRSEMTNGPRRTFLKNSMLTVTAGALGMRAAVAQAQAPDAQQPVVNLTRAGVVQISMVVRDVEKVARRFGEIWGSSWKLYEARPKQLVLHDRPAADSNTVLKIALGYLGGRSFKLIQPVSGSSSFGEFLKAQGEGFYSIGPGAVGNYSQTIAALKKAGVGIEMQGDLGNNSQFTILETVQDLGCRVELTGPPDRAIEANMKPLGTLTPKGPGIIDMERPLFTGGRRFTQVGIVLGDEKKGARRFQELFGVGGWSFYPIGDLRPEDTYVNEKLVAPPDVPSLTVDCASGYWGDMQLELLRPIGVKPGGCHQAFYDKHGNGFQHLNIAPRVGDYYEISDALKKQGIKPQFRTSRGDGTSMVSYFGMEEQLGGFVLEFGGTRKRSG